MCKDLDCPYKEIITNIAGDVGEMKGIITAYHKIIKLGIVVSAAYLGIDISGLI